MSRQSTLWSQSERPDPSVFSYTAEADREWDARFLRWDVLGSLGHARGMLASGLITPAEYRRMGAGLRAAVRAVDSGRLRVGRRDEDVHTAVENWLTSRYGAVTAS